MILNKLFSKTSWDRPKSVPYLRLKIAKGLQSVKVFSSTAPGIFFEKGLTMPKKMKGDPLFSSGFVCYAGNGTLFGSVPWANRGNLKFCRTFGRTILVTSGVSKKF